MEIEEKNNKNNPKEIKIYLKLAIIRKINQIILGTTFCYFIFLFASIWIMYSSLILWPDLLLSLLFWLFMGLLFGYTFTDDPINLIKPAIFLFGNLFYIIFIFILSIYQYFSLANYAPVAYIIYMILFLSLCVGGISNLAVNMYVIIFRRRCKKRSINLSKAYRTGKIKKVFMFSLVITGLPLLIMAIPGILQIPITIEPQDYEAEFAFWGLYTNVSSTVGTSLNDHEATLILAGFPDLFDNEGKQNFVNTYTYYNNTYPNISILICVPGDPGGFVWDGNVGDVINKSKKVVLIAQEYNLTTIKGLAFDLEAPMTEYLPEGFDGAPNTERHDNSIELWYDFFDWMDLNAPEMELSAINIVDVGVDIFDGDFDLHYISRFSTFDINPDEWDEIAPMVYRCGLIGPPPYGGNMEDPIVSYSDGGHYWVYSWLEITAKCLEQQIGNHNKMGVYLGISNCTCYGRDVQQYQNGQPAGYGYDNLVRDALIAKHFGVKRITFFILESVEGAGGYLNGGMFESYGDDFLDRFNESVNGEASTNAFTIWYKPKLNYLLSFGHIDAIFYDFYINLGTFIGIISIFLIFIGNSLIAYYGWNKIKNKAFNYYREIGNSKKINKELI